MSWRYPPPALRYHTTKSETEPSTSPLHYHAHFGTYVGLDAGVDAYRNCSGVGPFGEDGLGDVSGDNLGSVCQESEGEGTADATCGTGDHHRSAGDLPVHEFSCGGYHDGSQGASVKSGSSWPLRVSRWLSWSPA